MSDIGALLRFDPLAEAERATGESYKDDELTMSLGFGLAMAHNAAKADALRSTRDSHYGMTFMEALDLFANLGFEVGPARRVRRQVRPRRVHRPMAPRRPARQAEWVEQPTTSRATTTRPSPRSGSRAFQITSAPPSLRP